MPTPLQPKGHFHNQWTESAVVLGLSVGATAGYALCAGQDRNWDLRNYQSLEQITVPAAMQVAVGGQPAL